MAASSRAFLSTTRLRTIFSSGPTTAGSCCSGRPARDIASLRQQVDWPSYDGSQTGNRYTTLTEINKSNVGRLAPKWIYTIPTSTRLQVTPIVVDGLMYVTSANECYALDAGNGREIWRFQRPRTKGLIGNAAGGINRGVAVAGDRCSW